MDMNWMINRLRAMSLSEVVWRIGRRAAQARDRKAFSNKVSVCSSYFYGDEADLAPNWDSLHLNLANNAHSTDGSIELLADFDYCKYKSSWHSGFQTDADWPLVPSGDIDAGSDSAPGDLRTNWELNRHHQFAVLAKCYFVTGREEYLDELDTLFQDWNQRNPFLWGAEWTSAMELSIRLINWAYTAAFLGKSAKNDDRIDALLEQIRIGCANMAEYIRRNRSRYSSANNHAVVEAAGVGIAGYIYDIPSWKSMAFSVLDKEIARQNYSDGVSKEQALHYQAFTMEAYALYLHVRVLHGEEIPASWLGILNKCRLYVDACRVSSSSYIEFGDNDEGTLINFQSTKPNHFEYVLSFYDLLFDSNCSRALDGCFETLFWLFDCSKMNQVRAGEEKRSMLFAEGGVTILRSPDGRAVAGFDHGPLGFGRLAAHGHADALSVQLYVAGRPILLDPGTCIYNCGKAAREKYKSTALHNTVAVDGNNQSESLGPFLRGKRATADLLECDLENATAAALVKHVDGSTHKRSIKLSDSALHVVDSVESHRDSAWRSSYCLGDVESLAANSSEVVLSNGVRICCGDNTRLSLKEGVFSPGYLVEQRCLYCHVEPLRRDGGTSVSFEFVSAD